MKNLFVAVSVAALLPMAGFAQDAKVVSYAKDMYGDLNVGYAARPTPYKDLFYIGGRAGASFLTWKNEYKDENGTKLGSDSFSFKPLFNLNLFGGYRFSEKLRSDIEFGYISEFSESETEYNAGFPVHKDTFTLQAYNLTANVYYDLKYHLYVGAGAGISITKVALDDSDFGKVSSTAVKPMGSLMFGWVNELDENTDLDIRYRLSAFGGGDVTTNTSATTFVKTETGYVMDNSLSIGVRRYF